MMLSDRRQKVLSALIEEYVARALPVGSRTLVEQYDLGVSSATVRNELSLLEEAGYIIQPHTSAGRIPTDSGYRAFVDELVATGAVESNTANEKLLDELKAEASELDDLLEKTSVTLSRMTDCLSIVLAPSILAMQIKQISLVSLSDYQVLVVVITDEGQVFNRHVDFHNIVDGDEVAHVQKVLNQILVGYPLDYARKQTSPEIQDALRDPLFQALLEEVFACVSEGRGGKAHRLGLSSLVKKPEFSHSKALIPILELLENDTVLFHIFDEEFEEQRSMVRIGSENNTESLAGVSVVASQFGRENASGVVAVIGPTRMDYSKVLQAVHAAQQVLNEV